MSSPVQQIKPDIQTAEIDHSEQEQILAGVMHDIRTPLQIIAMSTELIATTSGLSDSGVLALSRMRRAMDRIVDMLDAVIESSGKKTRPTLPRPRAVAVDALLDNAVSMMRPIAESKDIRLVTESASLLGFLDVDYMGLMRVFSNLIDNAIKFSPVGSEVKLLASRERANIYFAVLDQGSGIAPDHLPRIFERCWQARPGESGGLGLGLAIVKEIVEINGGTVGARSTPGRGSEIWFTIPAP
jgi:signal transduction histidine kinase